MLSFRWCLPRAVVPALLCGLLVTAHAHASFEAGTHIPADIKTPVDYPGAPGPGEPMTAWFHVFSHPGATYIALHFVNFDLGPGDYLLISDAQGGQEYTLSGKGKMQAGTFW
ncbi:MAG: hypothetical protein GY778_01025, partial [bacterium]|nr:hypothetical protein [bacterium]